jgi:malic enzyme
MDVIPVEDVDQIIAAVKALPNILAQYSYLAHIRLSKPGLYFAALQQRPVQLLPIVYTPGVGDACLNWRELSVQPRGLVLSYADKGQLVKKLKEFRAGEAKVVVVTDGAQNLGNTAVKASTLSISCVPNIAWTSICRG